MTTVNRMVGSETRKIGVGWRPFFRKEMWYTSDGLEEHLDPELPLFYLLQLLAQTGHSKKVFTAKGTSPDRQTSDWRGFEFSDEHILLP